MPSPDPEMTQVERGALLYCLIVEQNGRFTTAQIAALIGRSVRQARRVMRDLSRKAPIRQRGWVWEKAN